jgi:hypothetical protein
VARLSGHTRWFYNQAGGNGVANPDAEFSEGPSIFERITSLREQPEDDTETGAFQELTNLSKSVMTALGESDLEANPRVALFFQELNTIDQELRQYQAIREEIRPLLQLSAFADSFNVEWLAIA